MTRALALALLAAVPGAASWAQPMAPQIEGAEVFKNDDVVFHRIDAHTWVGSGRAMASESLYLVEGNDKAVLIDAGTRIADLDKIVASITGKPIMLVATHAHPDHTGSAINDFPELFINPGDAASQFLAHYEGKLEELSDGEIIDLGGRQLEVVFTPVHTPGSTTFIDRAAGYGFSGDSFGSGNLLLFGTFSTLLATCQKTSAIMEQDGTRYLYPGHLRRERGDEAESRRHRHHQQGRAGRQGEGRAQSESPIWPGSRRRCPRRTHQLRSGERQMTSAGSS